MPTLKELLSAKREYKTLGEIATEICRGNGIKKEQLGTGNYPCIHYGELYTTHEIWFDKCISSINPDLVKNKRYCKKGDLLITATGESIELIAKTCTYLGKEKAIIGSDMFIIRHNQNPKYLSYALSIKNSRFQKKKLSTHSTVIHLNNENLKQIKIPIPPIEIQEKISEFLDLLREYIERVKREE